MPQATRYVDAPARVLMALLFLLSGAGKFGAISATQEYMKLHGIPGVLVWPAATFEVAAGLLLVVGLWLRPLGLVLAAWCILTAFVFHAAVGDQMQLINFLKNLVMAGGFLLLAKSGAAGLRADSLWSARERANRP